VNAPISSPIKIEFPEIDNKLNNQNQWNETPNFA